MKRVVITSALLAVVLAACGDNPPPSGPSTKVPDRTAGLAAFGTVRGVLQHPRCQNCHPGGEAPLQGEDGRPHAMNVQRGPTGHGMVGEECATCHGPANPSSNYGMHVPPGVSEGWRMPKPEEKLVFVGAEPRALCEQIKDPARNGGKDMAALRKHLDTPLVAWGWAPGFGRTPVPTPFPTFVNAWETWAASGAPCPN